MPRPIRTVAQAVAAIAAAAIVASASAQEMPKRKSGLWELTMAQGMVMTQCVDQSQDDAFRQIGRDMEKEMKCTRGTVQRGPGTMSFESTCTMGGTKQTSKTAISGDFDKAYRMDIQTKYDPPLMGNAQTSTTIEAKWIGPCKAGQRPGDMTMPGGMTINANDMMKKK
jgi:uncharacterized protein DUF3617